MRLLAVILAMALVGGVVLADDQIERGFAVEKKGTLDIDLTSGGNIDIEGWDKDSVAIVVELDRCDSEDFRYDIDKDHNDVEVYFKLRRHYNRMGLDLRARVPREYNIELNTAGGGVTISDVTGRIRGHTAGGSIDLADLEGEVNLTTGGGTVDVRDCKIDGSVTTGGGRVEVENVDGDFKANSGGGDVMYRNVKTPDREYSKDVVYIHNAGGSLNVRDAPAGAELVTGGGDIDVRSAGGFVTAHTGGGDITIDAVDGWIFALTGAGDIEATMVGDPAVGRRDVDLATGYGDITLTIPKGLSADIDVELSYTRDYRRQADIKSDVSLDIEESDGWIRDRGSARKIIYGTARVGNGDNRIRIRATNGTVTIREGD